VALLGVGGGDGSMDGLRLDVSFIGDGLYYM
jgi:hypothetical protein